MRTQRWLGSLGGVLGPCAVLLWALHVLTPVPQLGASAVAFNRLLRQQRSEVLVLGASFAGADIDSTLLGERLSPASGEATLLQVGASSAPVWYAILKERVYGNGLHPRLIVMPVSLGTAMMTRMPPAHMEKLLAQMPVPDEVVLRRSLGEGRFPAWERILDARRSVRDVVLHAFRDAPPRLLLGQGAAAVEAAGTEVFGEHHGAAGQRALPTVDRTEAAVGAVEGGWMVADPEQSYLSDIVDLAEANGARVVIVLPPSLEAQGQSLNEGVEAAVVAWAARRGVGLLDHRALGWDASHFRDGRHMTRPAAREFTALVADGIEALESAGVLEVAWTGEVVPATVVRTGDPPALPPAAWVAGEEPCAGSVATPGFEFLGKRALGLVLPGVESPIEVWEGGAPLDSPLKKGACSGSAVHRVGFVVSRREANGGPLALRWSEAVPAGSSANPAYWVFPGTSLTWTFAAPFAEPPATISLTAAALGAGVGAARLVAGEVGVAIPVSDGAAAATMSPPAEQGWTLSVTSPSDGPYLLLRTLRVQVGGASRDLIPPPRERHLDLLQNGMWSMAGSIPTPPARAAHADPEGAAFELGWVATTDCSPVRVAHGGALLPESTSGKPGTGTRHTQTRLTFSPLPGTDLEADYAVVYEPDRVCKRLCRECAEQVWLYPGEVLRAEVPERKRAAAGPVLGKLVLDVAPASPAESPSAGFGVSVVLGEETLLEAEVLPERFSSPITLPFSRSIAAREKGSLRVVFRSHALLPPLLVTSTLEEP